MKLIDKYLDMIFGMKKQSSISGKKVMTTHQMMRTNINLVKKASFNIKHHKKIFILLTSSNIKKTEQIALAHHVETLNLDAILKTKNTYGKLILFDGVYTICVVSRNKLIQMNLAIRSRSQAAIQFLSIQ